MQLDEREGAARFDALSPTRTTAAWLGLDERELASVPRRILEAIAARLTERDPEAELRDELIDRLHDSMTTLHQMARTDQLTGIANRRAIVERLSEEMARARRYRRDLAVFLLDVDDLKSVNDELGHCAGDRLLVEVGRRIGGAMRVSDLAGRWGGDEFVVICPETDGAAARALSEKLTDAICGRPLALEGRIMPVGVSVGHAVDGTSGDAESLLAAADASLYAAKQRRGRVSHALRRHA